MSGHMKGRVEAKRLFDNNGEPYSTHYIAHIDIDGICMLWAPPGNTEQETKAELIAEAFNVARETGRTPRQLADERAELVAALEGAEIILAKLDTIRHLDKSLGGLDQLRAVLAKVKGPVQS